MDLSLLRQSQARVSIKTCSEEKIACVYNRTHTGPVLKALYIFTHLAFPTTLGSRVVLF